MVPVQWFTQCLSVRVPVSPFLKTTGRMEILLTPIRMERTPSLSIRPSKWDNRSGDLSSLTWGKPDLFPPIHQDILQDPSLPPTWNKCQREEGTEGQMPWTESKTSLSVWKGVSQIVHCCLNMILHTLTLILEEPFIGIQQNL